MFACRDAPLKRLFSVSIPGTRSFSEMACRHLMSISDLSANDLTSIVRESSRLKQAAASGNGYKRLHQPLAGRSVAMIFSKRSTRTRVSIETAVSMLGGHPMFLGKEDIQLGVNESSRDTSVVISCMASLIFARVHDHAEVVQLAKYSSVPVINALSDTFHPLQALADLQTLSEEFAPNASGPTLGLEGLKLAWIGDCNNELTDLAIACVKQGVNISIASPVNYGLTSCMRDILARSAHGIQKKGEVTETTNPAEAINNADVIVTDTWVSMGQEDEKQTRMRDFHGFQVTNELGERGGAKGSWKFMHCLPRHAEEVDDEVFYGPRSLVFHQAANRLWTTCCKFSQLVKPDNFLGKKKADQQYSTDGTVVELALRSKLWHFKVNIYPTKSLKK